VLAEVPSILPYGVGFTYKNLIYFGLCCEFATKRLSKLFQAKKI
jgi:hypothetical protein